MRQACRIDVLGHMIETRRPRITADRDDKVEGAEEIILEIAELAYLLQADGFPVPEVFKRIGSVLDPPPSRFAADHKAMGHWSDPLGTYTKFYLKRHRPTYLELDSRVFSTASAIAELWAEINAERVVNSCWPHEDQLSKDSRKANDCLDALLKEDHNYGGCVHDYRRLKARAIPGDRVANFDTGALSWKLMMGTAGFALIRDGRSIDYVTTMMN
jgi:hypothetical protein